MPKYQSFLSGDNAVMFWSFAKYFLFLAGSVLMLFFAIDVLFWVIRMIKKAVSAGDDENDHDDDYDVYRY